MNPGYVLSLVLLSLVAATCVAAAAIAARRPQTLPLFSFLLLGLSTVAFWLFEYFNRRRYHFDWVTGTILKLIGLPAFAAFAIGFVLGLLGLARAVRVHGLSLQAVIPPLLYLAIITYFIVLAWASL